MSKTPSSYSQILKASAVIGGAQAAELLIRMMRVKVIAILLGPTGVGLIGVYQSVIELVGKVTGFGIRSSGVRQVAEANASGQTDRLGYTIIALRRIAWITGLLGLLLMLLMSWPLSLWLFDSREYLLTFSFLGMVLLVDSLAGGQSALLQGSRRISELASVLILSAVTGTAASLILFYWLGLRGIVPALIISASFSLACSWWYSRRITIPTVVLDWTKTIEEVKPLILLGLAFMYAGILTAGVAFVIRGLIIRSIGIDANGMYQAAWSISGMFAGFILGAMGQDFYPRLTAASGQDREVNKLVNEQTEVGILLALPGLLATLAFSPLVIHVFYSARFTAAADMLPWFVLGVFGRVISWPMGFIQLAKGSSKMFALTETLANGLHLLFVWLGLKYLGVVGVAIAFAAMYACYSVVVYYVATKLSGFRWSKAVLALTAYSAMFIALQLCVLKFFSGMTASLISLVLVAGSALCFLRQLVVRLGPDHRISMAVSFIPWLGRHGV